MDLMKLWITFFAKVFNFVPKISNLYLLRAILLMIVSSTTIRTLCTEAVSNDASGVH